MMTSLSILQCEAEKVCGVNVNYLKYYNIKKPSQFQLIQRRVMALNSFLQKSCFPMELQVLLGIIDIYYYCAC